jgi:hypothetical protein
LCARNLSCFGGLVCWSGVARLCAFSAPSPICSRGCPFPPACVRAWVLGLGRLHLR